MNTPYRRCSLFVAVVSICTLLVLGAKAEQDSEPAWYRGLHLSAPFEPFDVVGIGSETGNHLVATFYYFNYREGEKSPAAVTIHGSKRSDGTFWPIVTAQVANDRNGPWTTIGKPPTPGEGTCLSVVSKPEEERFHAQMDIFRPLIGKMKYGRVVLETGAAAFFALEILLPPKTDEESKQEAARK
jgi:hypothetical protein